MQDLAIMEEQQKLEEIRKSLKSYPDFPKKGILYYDIFSILHIPSLTESLLQLLQSRVKTHCPDVDVIVGLEARGFLFGLPLAVAFGIPFVPVRKRGKLPGKTEQVSFKLEYGEDVFEIQSDGITEGQTVVIVDDLLATGGTLKAANDLIQSVKGKVGLNLVCFELAALKGRSRVATPVQSLLQF